MARPKTRTKTRARTGITAKKNPPKAKTTAKRRPAKTKSGARGARARSRTRAPSPFPTRESSGAVVPGTDPCTCGHAPEEHGRDPQHPGSTSCVVCVDGICVAYEADPGSDVHEVHEADSESED